MSKAAVASMSEAETKTFSVSMVVSGVRCGLTYVILPLVGVGSGVGPWLGLTLGLVAIAANLLSISRFWSGDRKWKWPMTIINVSVIVLLLLLVVGDIRELLT